MPSTFPPLRVRRRAPPSAIVSSRATPGRIANIESDSKSPPRRLRRPRAGDLDRLVAIHSDPRTNLYNPAGPLPSRDAGRRLLEQWIADWRTRRIGYWAIESAGVVVGFGGVRFMRAGDEEVFNLYYRLAPEAWGDGIASHVALRARSLANEQHPGVAVLARMQPTNAPSRRTAQRVGLRRVGRDPWGRHVFADRPLPASLLAALPPT